MDNQDSGIYITVAAFSCFGMPVLPVMGLLFIIAQYKYVEIVGPKEKREAVWGINRNSTYNYGFFKILYHLKHQKTKESPGFCTVRDTILYFRMG